MSFFQSCGFLRYQPILRCIAHNNSGNFDQLCIYFRARHPATYFQPNVLHNPNNSARWSLVSEFYKEGAMIREAEWGTRGHAAGNQWSQGYDYDQLKSCVSRLGSSFYGPLSVWVPPSFPFYLRCYHQLKALLTSPHPPPFTSMPPALQVAECFCYQTSLSKAKEELDRTRRAFQNAVVGGQNMWPPNVPLWYKDYFELKTVEKEQT